MLAFQHVLEGYKVARRSPYGAGGLDLLRLVGVQDRGLRRHPRQRRDHASQGRRHLGQLDSADLARRLYQEAAKTIKYGGLTDEEALRFITLNPAKQLKMDHRIGIDVGKDGDLAIFNANLQHLCASR